MKYARVEVDGTTRWGTVRTAPSNSSTETLTTAANPTDLSGPSAESACSRR